MSNELERYYKSYHEKRGEAGYTGDRHAMTSRFLLFKEEIAKHVPKGGRILDIGCGSGTFAAQSPDYEWHGVDWDIGPAKNNPINAVVHNVEQFPYPYQDSSFDAITCSEVEEHCLDPIAINREVRRLLKRDGNFFLSTPQHTWIVNFLQGFQNLIYDHRMSHTYEHIRTYDLESHRRNLAEAGLIIEDYVGSCGHFCGVVNPMAMGVIKMLQEKYNVSPTPAEVHLAMGRAHPAIQHTIFLRCKKV